MRDEVPVMTSNTNPSGEAICSSQHPSYPAWQAFDKSNQTCWTITGAAYNGWIGYKFNKPRKVKKATVLSYQASTIYYKLEYSNDGAQWNSLSEECELQSLETKVFIVTKNVSAIYWRIFTRMNIQANQAIGEVQFYGRFQE